MRGEGEEVVTRAKWGRIKRRYLQQEPFFDRESDRDETDAF